MTKPKITTTLLSQQQQQQKNNNSKKSPPPSDSSPLLSSSGRRKQQSSGSAMNENGNSISSTSSEYKQPYVMEDDRDAEEVDGINNNGGSGYQHQKQPASNEESSSSDGAWNLELFQLVGVAATTAATLGYDVGSMAGAIGPLQEEFHMTSFQKELAMGSLNFIAALGAILGGPWADKYGRKSTVGCTCQLFLVGSILMAMAWNYWILLLGRIIAGLGVGVAFVAAPTFISEVSPPSNRGQLNTTFDIAINVGILLGYVVCYVVQITMPNYKHSWRIMLGLGALLPTIVLCLLSNLPESPRWLVLVNQQVAAKAVLQRLGSSLEESHTTVQQMEEEIKTFQELAQEEAQIQNSKPFYDRLSPGKKLALGLGFWQQISGTEAVLYYSADFLTRAGMESPAMRLLGNVFVGCCKLIPELISMKIVDTVGRRPLLILSSIMLAITITTMGIAFTYEWSALATILLLCGIMASFSTGVGPFTFLCASENLGLSERASGVTLCAAINRCTSGIIALTAVSISEWLGDAGLFYLYGFFAFGALLFYSYVVPETSGASLEELSVARSQQQHNKNQRVSLVGGESSITSTSNTSTSVEMEFRHLNPIT